MLRWPLGVFFLRAALANAGQIVEPSLGFPDRKLIYPTFPDTRNDM